MKILYTCQDITVAGGLERIICEKASAMAERGHEVWLLVCNPPGAAPAYTPDARVRLIDMALAPPRGLMQRLRFKLRQNAKILRAIRSLRPDITVVVPTWLSLAMIFAPRRLVLESHTSRKQMFHNELRTRYKRLKVAAAERKAGCVVSLTAEERDNWRRARRRLIIPNFSFLLPVAAAVRTDRFMAAGRLSAEKGFDMLVDAWAAVVRRHPAAGLDIYGDGPERESLERRAGALGIGENVCFKGRTADMASVYSSHAAFVLSSLYEGFGLVLIEAMRCGCAPVAFDCEYGPREILQHGESGIIVPFRGLSREERVTGLAAAICEMIENPCLCRQFAANAIADASRFDKDTIIDRWEALFGELSGTDR